MQSIKSMSKLSLITCIQLLFWINQKNLFFFGLALLVNLISSNLFENMKTNTKKFCINVFSNDCFVCVSNLIWKLFCSSVLKIRYFKLYYRNAFSSNSRQIHSLRLFYFIVLTPETTLPNFFTFWTHIF